MNLNLNRHLFSLAILGAVCSAPALPGARDPGQAVAVLNGDKFMPFYWTMIWPHAFVADDQVFCAFQNSLGQPMITTYDIEQGEWGPVHLVSERALRPKDTHGNPSITVDSKGFVHLFHSSHVTTQFHSRTVRPYDVTDWEPLNPPAAHATYPQSFFLDDGQLYLFFRDGFHYDAWQMMISSDQGESWDSMTDLVDMRRDPVDIFAGAYVAFRPGYHRDTIHAFWVYKDDNPRLVEQGIMLEHPWGGVKYPGLGEAVYRYHLYYMKRRSDGVWVDLAGNPLELPVTKRMADTRCRVLDSGDEFVGVRGVAIGEGDQPYVHFTSGVRDWQNGGPDIVPTRHLYATTGGQADWAIEEGLPESWPASVRMRLTEPHTGVIAEGDRSHGQWTFDFEYAEDGRTLLFLTHSEKGVIPRKGGPTDCP